MVDLKELKIIKYKCQKDLLYFTRYFFKKQNRKRFKVDPHHIIIAEALERVIKGECPRLIINLPPRYNKTTLAVHHFIAHCLANNPKAKFIHLSYSDSLALDNSETVKEIVQSEEFQELFDVQIKHDSSAKNKWYTTEGGGVLARSAAGQVIGFGAGAEPPDEEMEDWLSEKEGFGGAIIIDDPIKPEDADSPVIRGKVNLRFETSVRNRVNHRTTPIVVIMQRLHPMDLSGYLIDVEPDKWEVISLPAIQEDEEGNKSALCDRIHTLEELEELKKVNELVFGRQYQQNPQPAEGLLFHKQDLNWYSGKDFDVNKPEIEAITGFVDVANKGKDKHCMVVGFNVGPKIFIQDVVFTAEGTDLNVRSCAEMINKYAPHNVRIEANGGGSTYRSLLRPFVTQQTQLFASTAVGNKHIRIYTLAGFVKEFCYFRDDGDSEYKEFLDNFTEYLKDGSSEHEDAPDTVTGLVSMIRRSLQSLYPAVYLQDKDGYSEKES